MSSEAWAGAMRRRELRKQKRQDDKPTSIERENQDDNLAEALRIAQERADKSAAEVAASNKELICQQLNVDRAKAVHDAEMYHKNLRNYFLEDSHGLEMMVGHIWQFEKGEVEKRGVKNDGRRADEAQSRQGRDKRE